MADEKSKVAVVVHGPNAKPERPPVGAIHYDAGRRLHSEWSGTAWIPLPDHSDKIIGRT